MQSWLEIIAQFAGGPVREDLPPLDVIQSAYIGHVLEACGGNRSRAARVLGIARETLRLKVLREPTLKSIGMTRAQ